MRNVLIGFIVLITVSANAKAQTDSVYSFSLKEAQEFALNNNLEIKNSKLDIEAARKRIWETTAIGLPHAEGSLNYQYIPGNIPTFNFAEGFLPIIDRLNSYHPGGFDDIIQGMSQAESPIAVRSSATYGITVSQLIFSGEYIVGLQASKTYLMFSENMNEITELDIKETVSNNYILIKNIEESIKVLDSSLNIFSRLVYENKKMYEEGLLESTDVAQLELTHLDLKNSLEDMKRLQEVSYNLLKIGLGLDNRSKINLKESIEQIYDDMNIEEGMLNYKFNIENNSQYKLLVTNEKLNSLSFKREKSTFLPSVAAFYNYQDKTEKANLDFTINHIIGLSVTVPIFSSGQRMAKVQQAKIELDKSINTKKMTSDLLNSQAEMAYNDVVKNYNTYENSKKNVDLSKTIFDNTLIKYKNGMASSLELSQANNQYLLAISKNITILNQLIDSKIKLDKLNNNL